MVMKRFVILFLVVVCYSLALCARNNDRHLVLFVGAINSGNYEEARKELLLVKNWEFDEDNEKLWISNLNQIEKFILSIEPNSIPTQTQYDFALHLASNASATGCYYRDNSYFSEALPFLQYASETQKLILGDSSPYYAMSLYNLMELYWYMDDYPKAEQLCWQISDILKAASDEGFPDYATPFLSLAGCYYELGEYSKSEQYYRQALDIRKTLAGEQHADYASVLGGLGSVYIATGDYQMAEICLQHALEIYKNERSGNLSDYANTLNSLGALYLTKGEYQQAEQYFLSVQKTLHRAKGEQQAEYAMAMNNLGFLYTEIGDYQKAESYFLQALAIQKDNFGEDNRDYAAFLLNTGELYSITEDYKKAELYSLQALKIQKDILGEQHPDYAMSLNNLGILNVNAGDYIQAERYFIQSLDIYKQILGEQHPDYARPLFNLGGLYHRLGNYPQAEKQYLQALYLYRNTLGESHHDCINVLQNLGQLYYEMGNYSKAEEYIIQATSTKKDIFLRSIDYLSERQRDEYWDALNYSFYIWVPGITYLCHDITPSSSSAAYDNELFVKGLLLNASQAVQRSITESGDTALHHAYERLKSIKTHIIHLQENEPQSSYTTELQEQAEVLEKQLTTQSATYREHQRQWHITWDSVRTHLRSDEVAIEYMIAPLTEDSTMYCALLLRHGSEYPEMIPLFEEKQVASLINTASGSRITKTYSYADQGKNISRLVWSNILPRIKQGETVYFAPSGLLHQLAIEALPYDESHTMADQYNLVRVSSTREIAMNKAPIPHATATLYGGIQYNVNADTLRAESRQYDDHLAGTSSLTTDTIYRGRVDYLPGTKTEVEAINAMLGKEKMTAQVFTAARANEESFKTLSGTHQNILHIATHGFFWTDTDAKRTDYFAQRMLRVGNDIPTPSAIDPLSRCGLLFAGANTALQGRSSELPEGVQDGILTAKEISLIDLRDADLVVLSACETGMGEVTGDGVFGLQRAFKQAGVQTIVMSLWPVNDAATQLLMTEFYHNWISLHQPKREAFHNAQNAVRNYTTTTVQQASNKSAHQDAINKIIKNGQNETTTASNEAQTVVIQPFKEPVYWAGFVMLD